MIKFQVISPKKLLANPVFLLEAVRQGVQDTVSEGHRFIATYPPQTLTKTLKRTWGNRHFGMPVPYPRTMTLGKSWSSHVNQMGDRTEGIVGSNSSMAPYNRWVQGTKRDQVMIFAQAGWRGVADLKAKMEVDLPKNVQRNINKAVRK